MAKTTTPQPEPDESFPVTLGLETLAVYGKTYEILRFADGKGPNLVQTIAIAKSRKGKEMLTLQEAKEIRDDDKLDAAFRNVLKLGEWGHVRHPEAEKRSRSACLANIIDFGRLYVDDDYPQDRPSGVVFLKKSSSKTSEKDTG